MSATYNQNSPYYLTQYSQYFLDVMVNRPIPKLPSDQYFTINSTYQYRPDLLSFDLYDDSNLWWVFYQRNPNALNKPPLDFISGTQIYLPNINTLRTALGI
jgi:hypothetical protein